MGIDYTQIEFEDDEYPPKPQLKQQKKQRLRSGGLCKCCCIGFAIVLAVITFILVATITVAYLWTKNQVIRLTVEEPLPDFPTVIMSEAELNVIKDRAALFFDTLMAGEQAPYDLVLSAHEFNGLIGHSDYLRTNMYVDIQEGLFSVQMSLPADDLPGGKGRYFVSTGTVQNTSPRKVLAILDALHPIPDLNDPIFMADLDVYQSESAEKWSAILNSGEFMGNYAPPDFINERKNLLDDLYEDPDTAQVLNAISSITIEEDKIVIQANKKDLLDVASSKLPSDNMSVRDMGVRMLLRKLL